MRQSACVLHAVLIWTVAGCNGGARDAAEGVPQWSVSDEPEVVIGARDGPPQYLFQSIVGVRLLPDGRIVVADRGFSSIRVFDSLGTHQSEMGGPGQGPGEFGWLNHLSIISPDTILVYDSDLFRVTRFRPDGALIETRPIVAEGGRPEVYVGTFSNGDAALAWIVPTERDPSLAISDVMRMGRFGSDGGLVEVLGDAYGMRRMGRGPLPFSPFLHAFLVRDSVFHTDGVDPGLSVMDDGGAVARRVILPLPPLNIAEAWAVLRLQLAARDEPNALEWVLEAAEREPIPRIAEVLLDDSDRFWVKRYEPRTDSHLVGGWNGARGGDWTLVRTAGDVVARITLPEGFIPLDARGDRLAGIIRDALGVERVAVYRYGG